MKLLLDTNAYTKPNSPALMQEWRLNRAEKSSCCENSCDGSPQRPLYRPVRQEIAVELDKDVLEWFQKQPEPTQSLINQACRDYMQQHVNSDG